MNCKTVGIYTHVIISATASLDDTDTCLRSTASYWPFHFYFGGGVVSGIDLINFFIIGIVYIYEALTW